MGATELDVNLAVKVARAPYDTGRARVPWDAVDPLTQKVLVNVAAAYLRDALPVLTAAGWVPPETVSAIRDHISNESLSASHRNSMQSIEIVAPFGFPYDTRAGIYAYSEGHEHGACKLAIAIKSELEGNH